MYLIFSCKLISVLYLDILLHVVAYFIVFENRSCISLTYDCIRLSKYVLTNDRLIN